MSNDLTKQAIEILKETMSNHTDSSDELREAFRRAIQTLENRLNEKNCLESGVIREIARYRLESRQVSGKNSQIVPISLYDKSGTFVTIAKAEVRFDDFKFYLSLSPDNYDNFEDAEPSTFYEKLAEAINELSTVYHSDYVIFETRNSAWFSHLTPLGWEPVRTKEDSDAPYCMRRVEVQDNPKVKILRDCRIYRGNVPETNGWQSYGVSLLTENQEPIVCLKAYIANSEFGHEICFSDDNAESYPYVDRDSFYNSLAKALNAIVLDYPNKDITFSSDNEAWINLLSCQYDWKRVFREKPGDSYKFRRKAYDLSDRKEITKFEIISAEKSHNGGACYHIILGNDETQNIVILDTEVLHCLPNNRVSFNITIEDRDLSTIKGVDTLTLKIILAQAIDWLASRYKNCRNEVTFSTLDESWTECLTNDMGWITLFRDGTHSPFIIEKVREGYNHDEV